MIDVSEIPFEQVIQALLDDGTPFPAKYVYRLSSISPAEQASLAQALQAQNVAPGRRVRILSGPVPLENNILTSQTEKLRAQAVAREVFPYTRAVEIKLGQPTLQSGAIAVEFPPPAPQGS